MFQNPLHLEISVTCFGRGMDVLFTHKHTICEREGKQYLQRSKNIYVILNYTLSPASVSSLQPSRLRTTTPANLVRANFSIIASVEADNLRNSMEASGAKLTFLHSMGSDATAFHRRQTLDILQETFFDQSALTH